MRRLGYGVWLAAFVAGLGFAAAPPASAGIRLIGEQQELQMGLDSARQIEMRYRVSRDRGKTALVEQIGRAIVAESSRPDLPWKFRVLESPEVNALSLPGYVYVNTGLLRFVGNDRDELAAVIAHEVAHTTRKHAVFQTEKSLVGGLVLSLVFQDQKTLASNLAGMAANMALMGFGRKDELEADRVGADYMVKAGYDPEAMLRFFKKLQAKEGRSAGGLTTYFQSHPPTSERIRKVQAYLDSRPSGIAD